MEIRLEIPTYDKNHGFKHHWEDGFEIKVSSVNNEISILANKAGLVSLAVQMLTLAQETVPANSHFHLDEFNSLEDGSKELVIYKV
jgi:hypothetical protein